MGGLRGALPVSVRPPPRGPPPANGRRSLDASAAGRRSTDEMSEEEVLFEGDGGGPAHADGEIRIEDFNALRLNVLSAAPVALSICATLGGDACGMNAHSSPAALPVNSGPDAGSVPTTFTAPVAGSSVAIFEALVSPMNKVSAVVLAELVEYPMPNWPNPLEPQLNEVAPLHSAVLMSTL